jgi:cation transport regulator ChaB
MDSKAKQLKSLYLRCLISALQLKDAHIRIDALLFDNVHRKYGYIFTQDEVRTSFGADREIKARLTNFSTTCFELAFNSAFKPERSVILADM